MPLFSAPPGAEAKIMDKPRPVVGRSKAAVAARLRGGAGKHGDRRLKRLVTRGARKRSAIAEF